MNKLTWLSTMSNTMRKCGVGMTIYRIQHPFSLFNLMKLRWSTSGKAKIPTERGKTKLGTVWALK